MPEEKLAGYALDPAHPRGRHKARVFSSALGIERTDWRYLRDQLIEGIVEAAVLGTRITPFGVAATLASRTASAKPRTAAWPICRFGPSLTTRCGYGW